MADVVESIPGVAELWEKTKGDPRVCVALMDGPIVIAGGVTKSSACSHPARTSSAHCGVAS
jgi:hypothetical protein